MRARALPLWVVAFVLTALPLAAQEATAPEPEKWPEAIEDNSFLIEEAYNQDPGVVQFIFNFLRVRPSQDWQQSFTNEWPVPGVRHQLSYSIPYLAAAHGRPSGVGDVLLNYRYQALEEERDGVAFAPRITLILPTGNERQGLGAGTTGYQLGLPFSKRLSASFAAHLNLGATVWPGERVAQPTGAAQRDNPRGWNEGASIIWLASPVLNVFLEGVATQIEAPMPSGRLRWGHQVLLNPGVRAAVDTTAGQLVFGLSSPIGVTHDSPDPSLFLYLSWEMEIWHPR
jgi:hypothetical protein